jgi:hypothetical protein
MIITSAEDFYSRLPLYEKFLVNRENEDLAFDIIYYNGAFDGYCPSCARPSTFSIPVHPFTGSSDIAATLVAMKNSFLNSLGSAESGLPKRTFRCARDKSHYALVYLRCDSTSIMKIGQYPSLRDLHIQDYDQYSRILSDEKRRELRTAVNLASHGVSIGAFIYLRRIFEDLVASALDRAVKEGFSIPENWNRSPMDEKIVLLHDFLPSFLSENKIVYGILSKGVHALEEAECASYLSVIQESIELILDERLSDYQREKRAKTLRNEVNTIHRSIKQ